MNCKRLISIYVVMIVIFSLVLSTCSKKKKEEDITITLKTESAIPSQPITAPTSTSSRPYVREKPKPIIKTKGKESGKKLEKPKIESTPQTQVNKEAQAQQQLAMTAPPAQPQPSVEDVAKQEIMSIIKRQQQAMKTKNISLALEDLAGNTEQNKKALEDYFNRYEKIDVDFSNISIDINGNNAVVVMNQRTAVVTKSLIPQTITELTKVQWTFLKENNRWVISGTQILGRIKE